MSRLLWYPGHELLLTDIVRAENSYLYDGNGKRYVDLESGVWCTSIGHGHPEVLRALTEQSGRIAHMGFNYSNAVVEEAAEEILSLLGFDGGMCVFLCSGSEAVEYGVRVAQMVGRRPLLMTMTDSYFGAYGSAKTRRGDEWFCFDWMGCPRCSSAEADESCEHWASTPFEKIGGFLFEPGSSWGFVRFPPKRLIGLIVDKVKESDGLVLVNEVTTGIGRTGEWFGFQHYGIAPDIVAMGKGIGNGYPISVTAFSPGVIERLGGVPVPYAQSHQNDALGAAVARRVVGVIREEGLIERSRDISALLMSGLVEIKSRTGKIEEVRGRGLMAAIDLADDAGGSFTARTHRELARRGFIAARRPGTNTLRLDPPLTIEERDIEEFLQTLEDVLTQRSIHDEETGARPAGRT